MTALMFHVVLLIESDRPCLLLQLLSVVYPAEPALSADERILREADYYIRFVVHDIARAAEADDNDDVVIDDENYVAGGGGGTRYLIRLHKLLTFPSVQMACHNDVSVLR